MATKKKLDAVEMSRKGKARVSRLLLEMSAEEQEAYFRGRLEEFYASKKRARHVSRRKQPAKT